MEIKIDSLKVSVDIEGIKLHLEGEFDIIPDTSDPFEKIGSHLKVTELRIQNIDKLKVNVYGLGPLDDVIGQLSSFIGSLLRDYLSRVVEGHIKKHLQHMLDNLSIPKISNEILKEIRN